METSLNLTHSKIFRFLGFTPFAGKSNIQRGLLTPEAVEHKTSTNSLSVAKASLNQLRGPEGGSDVKSPCIRRSNKVINLRCCNPWWWGSRSMPSIILVNCLWQSSISIIIPQFPCLVRGWGPHQHCVSQMGSDKSFVKWYIPNDPRRHLFCFSSHSSYLFLPTKVLRLGSLFSCFPPF